MRAVEQSDPVADDDRGWVVDAPALPRLPLRREDRVAGIRRERTEREADRAAGHGLDTHLDAGLGDVHVDVAHPLTAPPTTLATR